MAITQESAPLTPSAAAVPVLWSFTSDTSDIVYLLARITIDGDALPAQPITPDGDGVFFVNASQACQDAFVDKARINNYNLRVGAANDVELAEAMYCVVSIDLWEVTVVAGVLTSAYPGTADFTTDDSVILNSTQQHTDLVGVGVYTAGTSSSKFMTTAPNNKTVGLNDSEVLYIFEDDATKVDRLRVKTYAIAGGTTTTNNSTSILSNNVIISIPVGPANLGIANTVYKYDVWLADSSNVATSEVRTYYLDQSLYYQSKRFHWINPLGGVDSVTLHGSLIKKQNVDQSVYMKSLPFAFNIPDRGRAVQASNASQSYVVESEYINDELCAWLHSMKLSPSVWVEEGNYVPVVLKPGESQVQMTDNPVNLFSIEYAYANDLVTLLG